MAKVTFLLSGSRCAAVAALLAAGGCAAAVIGGVLQSDRRAPSSPHLSLRAIVPERRDGGTADTTSPAPPLLSAPESVPPAISISSREPALFPGAAFAACLREINKRDGRLIRQFGDIQSSDQRALVEILKTTSADDFSTILESLASSDIELRARLEVARLLSRDGRFRRELADSLLAGSFSADNDILWEAIAAPASLDPLLADPTRRRSILDRLHLIHDEWLMLRIARSLAESRLGEDDINGAVWVAFGLLRHDDLAESIAGHGSSEDRRRLAAMTCAHPSETVVKAGLWGLVFTGALKKEPGLWETIEKRVRPLLPEYPSVLPCTQDDLHAHAVLLAMSALQDGDPAEAEQLLTGVAAADSNGVGARVDALERLGGMNLGPSTLDFLERIACASVEQGEIRGAAADAIMQTGEENLIARLREFAQRPECPIEVRFAAQERQRFWGSCQW